MYFLLCVALVFAALSYCVGVAWLSYKIADRCDNIAVGIVILGTLYFGVPVGIILQITNGG